MKTNKRKIRTSIKKKIDLNEPLSYIQSIVLLIQAGKLDKAREMTNLSLASDSFSHRERHQLLRLLAIIHIKHTEFNGSNQDLKNAKNLLHEALENTTSESEKWLIYLEIAKIHQLSSELKSSKSLYHKILLHSKTSSDKHIEVRAILGLGNLALEQQEADEALERGLAAMQLLETSSNDILLIETYSLIGGSYLKKRQQSKTKQYFKRALALAISSKYLEARCYGTEKFGRTPCYEWRI